MLLTYPLTIDNVTYDRLNVNLATSALYSADGSLSVSLVIRAVPVAAGVEAETGEAVLNSCDSAAASICVVSADVNQSPVDAAALAAIAAAIEQILKARGY